MESLVTWIFLGLVIPQLGSGQDELKRSQYRRMHHAVDRAADTVLFMRSSRSEAVGPVQIGVVTLSAKVAALGISTVKSPAFLDALVGDDVRCHRVSVGHFVCQFGQGDASANVIVC